MYHSIGHSVCIEVHALHGIEYPRLNGETLELGSKQKNVPNYLPVSTYSGKNLVKRHHCMEIYQFSPRINQICISINKEQLSPVPKKSSFEEVLFSQPLHVCSDPHAAERRLPRQIKISCVVIKANIYCNSVFAKWYMHICFPLNDQRELGIYRIDQASFDCIVNCLFI